MSYIGCSSRLRAYRTEPASVGSVNVIILKFAQTKQTKPNLRLFRKFSPATKKLGQLLIIPMESAQGNIDTAGVLELDASFQIR